MKTQPQSRKVKGKRIEPIERIVIAHPMVSDAFIYSDVTTHQLWEKQCEIIEVLNSLLARDDKNI